MRADSDTASPSATRICAKPRSPHRLGGSGADGKDGDVAGPAIVASASAAWRLVTISASHCPVRHRHSGGDDPDDRARRRPVSQGASRAAVRAGILRRPRDQDPHQGARNPAGMRDTQVEAGLASERGRVRNGAPPRAPRWPRSRSGRSTRPRISMSSPIEPRMAGDRRAAGAVEHRQEGPLGRERMAGRLRRESARGVCANRLVVRPDRDGDGALPDGGQEILRVEDRRHVVGETEPAQARHGQQRGMNLAAFELCEPRLHVAAQKRHLQVGPHAPDLRLPPQRRGADDPALGKVRGCL